MTPSEIGELIIKHGSLKAPKVLWLDLLNRRESQIRAEHEMELVYVMGSLAYRYGRQILARHRRKIRSAKK